MSAQVNQYIMLAVKFKWDDELAEKLEEHTDSAFKNDDLNPGGLHAICDGMNGDYIYLGHCYSKSRDGEHLGSQELVGADCEELYRVRDKIIDITHIDAGWPALHFITHYR